MTLVCIITAATAYLAIPEADPMRLVPLDTPGIAVDTTAVIVPDPAGGPAWRLDIPAQDRGQPRDVVLERCLERGTPKP